MISIDLPWPSPDLFPNARVHWARKAKAVKKARADAEWCARADGIRPNDPDIPQALKVTAVFSPPDNRVRDEDNMLAACKAYFDGISKLIGVDDSKWSISIRREVATRGGSVRIELEAA
ncbi:endonuclease [Mesorhizobium mediterraneum]|uniref:Uncharacterized protein n=1 Tax=Mesorhizobium mediterraneum TaxID=43617 RepID=A0AB36RFT4_9HYPH|nr:endodeoxyribonuclease RusA [Mesorhizobium mediterraneum]PAQ03707.1 hypothetical protein CIT25_04105 [Mesorhizobium mediterraneum]WIW52396.1 endonuclease [Mesorhizobium mediterraneum]